MVRASRPRRSWPRRIFGWLWKGVAVFVIGSVLWVLAYRFVNPPITMTMIGDMVAGNGARAEWLSIDEMDRDIVRAVIGGEDSKFCTHGGFDRQAIEAAMRRNAQGGSVIRGGSTISQQTAKNVFLWQGRGWVRKGLEAWFTVLIENLWSKRRIMEVYLNVAETGIGTYGANSGAHRYFGHDARTLTPAEAARIAAVLPLPKRRDAIAPAGFTRRYGNIILARIGVVRRDRLDACVYEGATAPAESPEPRRAAPAQPRPQAPTRLAPPPAEPVPGEELERPAPQEPAQPAPEAPSEAPPEAKTAS